MRYDTPKGKHKQTMIMTHRWTKGLRNAALLMATAMSICCCGEPPGNEQAIEFESSAGELHRDFFDKIGTFRRARSTDESKAYEGFRNEVQGEANSFLKNLAACKEQADADELYAKLPVAELRQQNDARRDALVEALSKSPARVSLKEFEQRLGGLKRKKGSVNADLESYIDEHGEDSYPDEIADIRYRVSTGEEKLQAIDKAIKGSRALVDGVAEEATRHHGEIVGILDSLEATYKGWVPPPPPPFHPEKILFTMETTPALYDSLISTLVQRYKQYTFLYTNTQGERCITDARNTEGVVIRLVEPEKFAAATDSLEQGRADVVIAFRNTYDAAAYEKLESKAAASEDEDLNSILVSGVAFNAVLLKVNQTSALEKLDVRNIGQSLQGYNIYAGEPGTVSGELYATVLAPYELQATQCARPEKEGTASNTAVAAVAFSRKPSAAKEVRVARIPSAEQKIYFWPRPGDIAAGRYILSASVNAAFNPASTNNAAAREFVDFVLSDEGQSVVKASDFVSINEYEENDEELAHLRKLFEQKGYTVGKIITRNTFLFPKNDARITKDPKVNDKRAEFKDFDSTIRSNFGHIRRVLKNTSSEKGIIAVGVIGHASSEGGEGVNRPLSNNRAKYTAACIRQGDKSRLILTDGMSSRVPVDDNKEEEGKVRNRRASAYVVEVFEIGKK